MIPVIIGIGAAVLVYNTLSSDDSENNRVTCREISENEIPPDVLLKLNEHK